MIFSSPCRRNSKNGEGGGGEGSHPPTKANELVYMKYSLSQTSSVVAIQLLMLLLPLLLPCTERPRGYIVYAF